VNSSPPNRTFERSGQQRRCWVPVALCAPAPGLRCTEHTFLTARSSEAASPLLRPNSRASFVSAIAIFDRFLVHIHS
jgi:hypothetical protein